MFNLKWVNFLGHSFNLKGDIEVVLIMSNGMGCVIVIIDEYVQCLPMYSGTKATMSVEIIFSL